MRAVEGTESITIATVGSSPQGQGRYGKCEGPTLAAFSPFDASWVKRAYSTGGGLTNSVGGTYGEKGIGWGGAVHLVCGRELP